jgi:antitoxin component of RelBE/YafQ-DinJ toxin-antitoxin module
MSYTIQIDNEKMKKLEDICKNLGVSFDTVINNFVNSFIVDPFYLKENQEFLSDSIKQLENGEGYIYNDVDKVLS